MSAVPVPAEVLAGTSDLPSRAAFILSAKAGPAKASVAASASEASTVFFDMVFSLLTSRDGVKLETVGFRIYSRKRLKRRQIFRQLMAGITAILAMKSKLIMTDR